eukprot:1375039-Amorphochlora_amoeboformis.AAC.2
MKCILNLRQDKHGDGEPARFKWDPTGRFLCTCGANRRVHVWTRAGEEVCEISLRGSGRCLEIAWDFEGEVVAILQERHPEVVMYNVHTDEQFIVDIGDGLK